MEHIDTYNYHAWFLDFVEDRLDAMQVRMLDAFLALHPQLAEELGEFENIGIRAVTVEYKNKLLLKKGDILDSYIDEQCIAYIEKDLDDLEQLNFQKMLLENPDLHKNLKMFEKSQLQADKNIVFAKKHQLKHHEIKVSSWQFVLSAAASVALIMSVVFVFKNTNQKPDTPLMVHELVVVKPSITAPNEIINNTKTNFSKKPTQKHILAKRENISLNNMTNKNIERIAMIENAFKIEQPIDNTDEIKSLLANNIEIPIEPENNEPEQFDNLLWVLTNKSIDMLNRYKLTNIVLRKEKDAAQQSTLYAFDTKWVSVYAYVNDEK